MKKSYLFLLLTLLTLTACNQDKDVMSMKGSIKNVNQVDLYVYAEGTSNPQVDTIRVRGGEFTYSRSLSQPEILTLLFPNFSELQVVAEPGTSLELVADASNLSGTIIKGKTEIGENCVIGPNSFIEDSKIGDGVEVNSTQIRSSVLEKDVKIGPWSHVRPGCVIHEGCKIGDYVEIKNSEVGARTAVAHLTYIGDADVGEAVNFGCGCCIANYDGQHKHRTKIGDHAFLGCNTNLVAPVELEDFAYTAAGTTVTRNVPEYALAVGRAKQENIEGWVKKHDAIKIK